MAALDELNLENSVLKHVDREALKDLVAMVVWQLYDEHLDMTVFRIKWAFISKTFRVRDLKPLLEFWLGPREG